MSTPRAFISFDFDNNERGKNLFRGQAKNSRTPFSIEDWSSKASLPQAQWEQLVNQKINNCHLLIVLVGQSMPSATGVNKEINMAKNNNVPIFGIYVNGANTHSSLPIGLARNRVISWGWEGTATAISQMMTEGKNK